MIKIEEKKEYRVVIDGEELSELIIMLSFLTTMSQKSFHEFVDAYVKEYKYDKIYELAVKIRDIK